jgi:hypothetical protein
MNNDPRLDHVHDLRTKAKELRTMAAGMRDLGARALCLRMAMSYEDLAHNKERQVTASPLEEKPEAG